MFSTGVKSYFACGWSAITYWFAGMPKDKPSYWSNDWGFGDMSSPAYAASVEAYRADPSFHHLKDIAVEWTRAWPQRAAKLSAMLGMIFMALAFLGGALIGALVVAAIALFM